MDDEYVNRIEDFNPIVKSRLQNKGIKEVKLLGNVSIRHTEPYVIVYLFSNPDITGTQSIEQLSVELDHHFICKIPLPVNLFDGFTNLKRLYISHQEFNELPREWEKSLGNIETLGLSDCNLIEIDYGSISWLKNLKILHLTSCQLDVLGMYTNLESLEEISFRSVHVSAELLEYIFSNFPNLQKVQFNNTGIFDLPEDLFQKTPKLHHIDFYDNGIESIPKGLFDHLTVEYLDVSDNYLTELNLPLQPFRNCSYIAFGKNRLTKVPNSIKNMMLHNPNMYISKVYNKDEQNNQFNDEIQMVERLLK